MASTKPVITAGKRCGFTTKSTVKTSWKAFENSGLNTGKRGCVFTVIALRNMEKVCVRFTQKEKECGIKSEGKYPMNEELKALFCDEYCRFPYLLTQEELDEKCENCPLNEVNLHANDNADPTANSQHSSDNNLAESTP